MLSIFLIIIGHMAYGVTNGLWKSPRDKIGTLPLILTRSFSCCMIFLCSYLLSLYFQWGVEKHFTSQDIFYTLLICMVNYFGLFFYLKSLKYTQVSNTIGFGKMGLIIGILIGVFFYNESISWQKGIVCGVIVLAVSIIEKTTRMNPVPLSKGLIYSFLSRLFWATGLLFVPFIQKLGIFLFCTLLEAVVFSMSLILYLLQKEKQPIIINNKTKYEIMTLIVLGSIGTFCLNLAITQTSIIVFAFLGLIEPIIGILVAIFYYQEKISRLQYLGLAMGIIASFVLSIL